ncbi:DNA-directed RNA polymerase II subunit RPB1-like [Penaeus vannamei]|uniref:DNA-directed RNA polymerase II subunit RPB1-like n=1 Tax=Penaeus vannamei TaxID=6689 RepID=UPI00387F3FDA
MPPSHPSSPTRHPSLNNVNFLRAHTHPAHLLHPTCPCCSLLVLYTSNSCSPLQAPHVTPRHPSILHVTLSLIPSSSSTRHLQVTLQASTRHLGHPSSPTRHPVTLSLYTSPSFELPHMSPRHSFKPYYTSPQVTLRAPHVNTPSHPSTSHTSPQVKFFQAHIVTPVTLQAPHVTPSHPSSPTRHPKSPFKSHTSPFIRRHPSSFKPHTNTLSPFEPHTSPQVTFQAEMSPQSFHFFNLHMSPASHSFKLLHTSPLVTLQASLMSPQVTPSCFSPHVKFRLQAFWSTCHLFEPHTSPQVTLQTPHVTLSHPFEPIRFTPSHPSNPTLSSFVTSSIITTVTLQALHVTRSPFKPHTSPLQGRLSSPTHVTSKSLLLSPHTTLSPFKLLHKHPAPPFKFIRHFTSSHPSKLHTSLPSRPPSPTRHPKLPFKPYTSPFEPHTSPQVTLQAPHVTLRAPHVTPSHPSSPASPPPPLMSSRPQSPPEVTQVTPVGRHRSGPRGRRHSLGS